MDEKAFLKMYDEEMQKVRTSPELKESVIRTARERIGMTSNAPRDDRFTSLRIGGFEGSGQTACSTKRANPSR